MIRNDPATDSLFKDMYAAYSVKTLKGFQEYCGWIVDRLHGKADKLAAFKREIMSCPSKDRIVTKMTNFLLAGQNLKVL